MARAIKMLAAVLALAFAYGCQTTQGAGERVSPTHRWILPVHATQARYNLHHNKCVEEAGVNPQHIRRADPAFEQYEQCMMAKGYTLATY